MKTFFLIFSLIVLLAACSDKDKLPKGVLPPEKMRDVLWDMIRAGEFLNGYVLSRDSSLDKAAESQKWYNKIYQMHKVNKAQFDKSFAYYKDHPLLLKTIFDSLARKQVNTRPVPLNADTTNNIQNRKIDTLRKPDSFRLRVIDSLRRKKIIKKRNLNPV